MIACECPLGICDGSGLIPVKGGNNFCDCHQSRYEATPHYTEFKVGDFDYAVSYSFRRYEAWLEDEYLPEIDDTSKPRPVRTFDDCCRILKGEIYGKRLRGSETRRVA